MQFKTQFWREPLWNTGATDRYRQLLFSAMRMSDKLRHRAAGVLWSEVAWSIFLSFFLYIYWFPLPKISRVFIILQFSREEKPRGNQKFETNFPGISTSITHSRICQSRIALCVSRDNPREIPCAGIRPSRPRGTELSWAQQCERPVGSRFERDLRTAGSAEAARPRVRSLQGLQG